jgi:hypothetical protein
MKYTTLNLIKAAVVLSVFFTVAHAAPVLDGASDVPRDSANSPQTQQTPSTTPYSQSATDNAPTAEENSHASAWSSDDPVPH